MRDRRSLFAVLLGAGLVLGAPAFAQQDKIRLVATTSILADFARNVGGDRVHVTALVGPNGDAHVYAPTPADAKTLSEAKIVVLNGLGLEGWMTRLVKASGAKAPMVVATTGIKPLKMEEDGHGHGHGHAETDPHAWQSVANARIYVANIRDGLAAIDPENAAFYSNQAAAYLTKLDLLETEVKAAIAKIPADRRKIITTHDAFGYFAAAYGMTFIAPQGVSTEAGISARDVGRIIRQIKRQKIPAVFLENISDPRVMERIAAESGAKVGGTLYSDSLSDEKGPAATYLDMMRNNIREFSLALTS
ncbi:MAG: metal ABC transporter substrate-binding protein [Pseudorhodoplanes sp.]